MEKAANLIWRRYAAIAAGVIACLAIAYATCKHLKTERPNTVVSSDSPKQHTDNRSPAHPAPVASRPVLPVTVQGVSETPAIPRTIFQALYGKEFQWDARLRYIDALGTSLSANDVALLMAYLRHTKPDDGLRLKQRLAFCNDIIFALRSQKNPPSELTALLIGIFNDPRRDPGMRDYAIQHLSEWRWRAVQRDADAAELIDNALWSAVGETSRSYAGTALLALHRLVEDQKMPDYNRYVTAYKERLATAAHEIASNANATLAARISAMGICGEIAAPEATPVAAALLGAKDTPPTLQLAAMGALSKSIASGAALDPEMRAILEHAACSDYPPLKALASATLRNHAL